jgi:uncharacterized protein (TIGR00299 family) protein
MTAAYIECLTGFNSEMLLGAWFDLGLQLEEWQNYMAKIGIHKNGISVYRTKVNQIAATTANLSSIELPSTLSLFEIEKIIECWELPEIVKEKSKLVFQQWGNAEAKVRDTDPNLIQFDYGNPSKFVGNIVGNFLAWHLIGEPECYVSTIGLGGRWKQYNDEWKPLPEPAVIELLLGYPTLSDATSEEVFSAADAALIRTLAVPAPIEAFIGEKVGYGASSDHNDSMGILRIQLGKWSTRPHKEDTIKPKKETIVIETNIDDMNPEWAGYLVQHLLSMGAMDAYVIPIIMKKGRPGLLLRVACIVEKQMTIQEEIVRQTTTLGMRFYKTGSWGVPKKIVQIRTSLGDMPVKFALLDGEIVNVAPEYEACREAAESLGISVKSVYQTVLAEALVKYPFSTKPTNI